jgi:hypothetical protein
MLLCRVTCQRAGHETPQDVEDLAGDVAFEAANDLAV